jgi:hypothetical protein
MRRRHGRRVMNLCVRNSELATPVPATPAIVRKEIRRDQTCSEAPAPKQIRVTSVRTSREKSSWLIGRKLLKKAVDYYAKQQDYSQVLARKCNEYEF